MLLNSIMRHPLSKIIPLFSISFPKDSSLSEDFEFHGITVLVNWSFTPITMEMELFEPKKHILTLMRATSGSLARCGGWWPPPPLSILALEQILTQKSCFPKSWHQFQLIWPLFGNFFQKLPKKLAKIENPSKNG